MSDFSTLPGMYYRFVSQGETVFFAMSTPPNVGGEPYLSRVRASDITVTGAGRPPWYADQFRCRWDGFFLNYRRWAEPIYIDTECEPQKIRLHPSTTARQGTEDDALTLSTPGLDLVYTENNIQHPTELPALERLNDIHPSPPPPASALAPSTGATAKSVPP